MTAPPGARSGGESPAARRAVDALLADRESDYMDEYRRLVEAVYDVVQQTGNVDPKVADIVGRAGLSNQVFYRHFASKDELLQAVLDDGRHRLVGYLEHRMSRTSGPAAAIEEWIRGVMVQAVDPDAARRSRPFAVHAGRLSARFPDAQTDSVMRLRELLSEPVKDAVASGDLPPSAVRRVDLVLWTAFDAMQRHLIAGTTPTDAESDDVVGFCLAGLGATTV